ncbi:MAG: ABC transporter ATP-binding protein [Promethearchaeota archaeon]
MSISISKKAPSSLDNDVILKLESLSKNYGGKLLAVDNVNLEVKRGETIGLVGPNGAGKTTIIKMIAKLLRPTSGRILLKNKEGELQEIDRHSKNLIQLGFLIDIPSFYDMNAYQTLKYFAKLHGYPKEKIDTRIDELLALFKLSDWKYKKIRTFSKGMTQKMGIIQAIIHDPEIIILDEPQTGLDPKARVEVRKYIRQLQHHGKTIFVASHMLYEISEVCDKIALINRGKIIAFDSIENLEKKLKTNELKIRLLNEITTEKLESLKKRIVSKLEPYLDKKLDPTISKSPIKYNPYKGGLKIYYNGKDKARAEILKILIKDFEKELIIVEYTQPKASQLERIYSQMITDDNLQNNNIMGGDEL